MTLNHSTEGVPSTRPPPSWSFWDLRPAWASRPEAGHTGDEQHHSQQESLLHCVIHDIAVETTLVSERLDVPVRLVFATDAEKSALAFQS
jgi:hypothetical protein